MLCVMITNFKTKICFVLSVAVASAHIVGGAAEFVRIDVPSATHADAEASSIGVMPPVSPKVRTLRFELSLDATPGNNAELSFGKSRGGRLSLAGTQTVIGWDRGAWVLRSGDLRKSFSTNAVSGSVPCQRKLIVSVNMKPTWVDDDLHGQRKEIVIDSITFSEERKGGGVAPGHSLVEFPGLSPTSAVAKAWFDYRGLDAFRAVSRGGGGVSAAVKVLEPGTVLILR